MGASLPFSSEDADFSGFTSAKGIFIDKTIHKSIIEVNEEGLEAAAATDVIISANCARLQSELILFICDRPFMFLIHDRMFENIYFVGKYAQPK